MKLHTGKRTRMTAAAILLAAAALVSGCGSDEGGADVDPGAAADAPSYEAALADAPPKLERLYENGSELIEGGGRAYEETLAGLRGYPVVVNTWGSWCGPCREEFPLLQSQAAEYLDQVAFLGIDVEDSPDASETFLRDHPIPYPSVADPDRDFVNWIDTPLIALPNTLFYDEAGKLVYVRQGPYESEEDLAADIERYALDPAQS